MGQYDVFLLKSYKTSATDNFEREKTKDRDASRWKSKIENDEITGVTECFTE